MKYQGKNSLRIPYLINIIRNMNMIDDTYCINPSNGIYFPLF